MGGDPQWIERGLWAGVFLGTVGGALVGAAVVLFIVGRISSFCRSKGTEGEETVEETAEEEGNEEI